MGKEKRINVRAKGDSKERLAKACEVTGATEASLVMACVEALIDYIEAHGEITLPLVILPKSALKKRRAERKIFAVPPAQPSRAFQLRAAEEAPPYKAKRKRA